MQTRERVLSIMNAQGLDAVAAVAPENVYYLSGARLLMQRLIPERKTYMILTADNKATLITAGSDADHARRDSNAENVIGLGTVDDATEALGRVLTEMGLGKSKVGIETGYLSAADVSLLNKQLPTATLTAADEVFRQARMTKLPHEVDLLRRAEHLTELAITAAMGMSGEGDTEIEMTNRIAANMCLRGAQAVDFILLTTGLNSTVYHLPPSDYRAVAGDVVHLDCGGQFENYRSDMSRNVGITKLPQSKLDIYARLWDVQREIIAYIRPGRRVSELCAKYLQLMEQNRLVAPSPYLGHGVGLSSHEFPEMTADCEAEILPGMVLAIEPTTFVAGDARYDVEDTVVVTETGCEMLSGHFHTREMWVV